MKLKYGPKNYYLSIIISDYLIKFCFREFFERTILCNSLVWSCSLTGRSGMTYQEAIESEEKARKQLGKFPETLLRPILFLVSLNRDIGLSEMVDNIHSFVKDRYFIGETIELLQENKRHALNRDSTL